MGQCKKQEDKVFVWKVFEELSAFRHEKTFHFWQTFDFGQLFYERTIPRRLSKERFWFLRFRQWLIKTETWNLRLDNFSVFSGFLGLRAEVTLEKETPEFRKVTSRAESERFKLCRRQLLWILTQFCRNSVWILFWENFYNYLLRNKFSEDWKLKIIALIYGCFDLIAFCGELTLRFWQTFLIYERKVHLDKVRKDGQNRYSKRICATRLKAKRQKTNYMTKHRTHNRVDCPAGE